MRAAGGAGNKALLVLEEPSACYIQDRGLCRWDTCAAQGVLEAHGGVMVKLHPLIFGDAASAPRLEPYRYLAADHPDDFVEGATRLTKYNAAAGMLTDADAAKGAPPKFAQTMEQLKPHKNGLGPLRSGVLSLSDRSGPAAIHRAAASIRLRLIDAT